MPPSRMGISGRHVRPAQMEANTLTTEDQIPNTRTTPATTESPTPDEPRFHSLGVIPEIADALEAEGIVAPFPIQTLALPLALGGADIIGQARTGTGKTLAFGLPLLQRSAANPGNARQPRCLVVVPTRELAIQVAADLETAGKRLNTRILTVYGGRAYEPQIKGLRAGVDVVVGTPGRLLDLQQQGYLDLSRTDALVLDEADKMLDLGFLPDVERILTLAPEQRQVMLFSATMPSEIVTLSRNYLHQPTHVRTNDNDTTDHLPASATRQHVYRTHALDKEEMLARLLQAEGHGLSMVFCHTKRACDKVAASLTQRGFAAAAVHGDLGQGQRERALRAFRNGKIDVLVATDVAARGLDVDDVTHVVNYECPDDEKTYVHRVGRTGRAGRTGTAVTFIDWQEVARWRLINATLGLELSDPPETYSTSDHFFTDLDIPAGTKGSLAKDQRDRAGLAAEEVEDIGETNQPAERPKRRGTRSRSGNSGRGRGHVDSAASEAPAQDTTNDGGAAATPRRRRRRRTRGGVDIPSGS